MINYDIHEVERLIFAYESELKRINQQVIVVHGKLADLYRIKNKIHKKDNLKSKIKKSKL